MLKQSRPTRAMRGAGLCLVAGMTLAFAWTAWASQSSRPATVAAAGRSVDATLRLDVDGKPGKPVRIVHALGSEFEIADGDWRAAMVANATANGDVALDATLRRNGRVVSTPSVVARRGEPFSVAIGDAGHETFRIEGTLAFADAPQVPASRANAAGEGDREATYRTLKPPIYPAHAVKERITGEVYVKATIGRDGAVLDAKVDHAKPESSAAVLGDAAVAAVKSWTFEPARSGGVATSGEVLVPIKFSLHEFDAAAPDEPATPGALDAIVVRGDIGN